MLFWDCVRPDFLNCYTAVSVVDRVKGNLLEICGYLNPTDGRVSRFCWSETG